MPASLAPLAALAVVAALAFSPAPAAALSFSGSFTGIAHAEGILGGDPDLPASYYDGAEITGTFRASIPDAHLATWNPEYLLTYGTGSTYLDFTMKGKTFAFPSAPSNADYPGFLSVRDAWPGETRQALTFHDHYYLKYHGAAFSFSSPPETLFQNLDLTTIQVNADTVSSFDTYFTDSNTYLAVQVDVRSFRFDTLAAPVPEPGALLLLGLGAGLAAAGGRRGGSVPVSTGR